MERFRIRHLDKAIVSNKQMTLLDILMDVDSPNFPLIKLLLEMGASPENRYLDLQYQVLSVALKTGDTSTVSLFASHGFGSKDQYSTSSDKVLWEIAQAFNKKNSREYLSTGWEKGFSSDDVILFLLLRSDIYQAGSFEFGRHHLPSVPDGYLEYLKKHLDQCSDPDLLCEGLEIYGQLTNRQDIQSLFDEIVKAQLGNSKSEYRRKVFTWYVSHQENVSPVLKEVLSKTLVEEVLCEDILSKKDFSVLKDMLALYKKWPDRETSYVQLVRNLFDKQLRVAIDSAEKGDTDVIGLENLESLSKECALFGEMLGVFMSKALELNSPKLVELLINCSSHETLKANLLIGQSSYRVNDALCALYRTIGNTYPEDRAFQKSLLKRFYDGEFLFDKNTLETFLNTLLDCSFDISAIGRGEESIFRYALRTSHSEQMIEKILENSESKTLLRGLKTIVSDLLYHKLPRLALAFLNEGAVSPKSEKIKHCERTDEVFYYIALIKKLIDQGTTQGELENFFKAFFFDHRKQPSKGLIEGFLKVNTPLQDLQLDTMMTTKNLAHVVGDVFVKDQVDDAGESLEGNVYQQSIALFCKLLDISNAGVMDEIGETVSALGSMYTISQYLTSLKLFNNDTLKLKKGINGVAEWMSGQIRSCPDQKPFLMPLQFSNHATLIEFVKKNNGKYHLKLYNTGYGLEYHDKVLGARKNKFLPFMEFSNIPEKEICSPLFLKSLIEPGILSEKIDRDLKITFDAADVYEGVLKRFEKYRVPTNTTDKRSLITGQRSGTCSFRCLQAYLRDRLGESRYKKVMFNIKRKALDLVLNGASYEELKKQGKRRRLIQDAVSKLARKGKKRLVQGNLSPDELESSVLFIESAKGKLRKVSKPSSSTLGNFDPDLCELLATEQQKNVVKGVVQKWRNTLSPFNPTGSEYSPRYSPHLSFDFNCEGIKGEELIDKLRSLSKFKSMKECREVLGIFHEAIIQLPLPPSRIEGIDEKNPWCQLKQEERSECLKILSDLSFEYLDFIKKAKNTTKKITDQHIAIHKLLACSYGLALMNDHAVLESTSAPSFMQGGIFNNLPLGSLQEHRVLHSCDPKVEDQLDDLCDFFVNADIGKESGSLFDIASPFFSRVIESQQGLGRFRKSPQYRFLASYPLSNAQIDELDFKKNNYNEHFRLNSHLVFDDFKVVYLWKNRLQIPHLEDYFNIFDVFYNCIKLANSEFSSKKLSVDFIIISKGREKTKESCITSSQHCRSKSKFNHSFIRKIRGYNQYQRILHTPGLQNPTLLSRPEMEQTLRELAFSPHLAISRLITLYSGLNLYRLVNSTEQEFFTHLLFYHKALSTSLVTSSGNSGILLDYLKKSLGELKVQMASYNSAAATFIRNDVKEAEEAFAEQSRLGMAYLFLLHTQNSVFQHCISANIPIDGASIIKIVRSAYVGEIVVQG